MGVRVYSLFLGGNAGFMGLYHQPYDLLLPRSAASKIVTGRARMRPAAPDDSSCCVRV